MQAGFTKYSYPINTATANGKVGPDALKAEIAAAITTPLDELFIIGITRVIKNIMQSRLLKLTRGP